MVENPFWQYSLRVYARPAVAEALLRLQDDCGADVNMLLCSAWLAENSAVLDGEPLRQAMAVGAAWQSGCVAPLRSARRFLKGRSAETLREQVKLLELAAERLQQDALYALLSPMAWTGVTMERGALLRANLRAYLAALMDGDLSAQAAAQLDQLAALLLDAA